MLFRFPGHSRHSQCILVERDMKKPVVCPNCSSSSLYQVTVNATGLKGGLLPIGLLNGPRYENIVCGDCGLTQWFVAKDQIHLVKSHLAPLPVGPTE